MQSREVSQAFAGSMFYVSVASRLSVAFSPFFATAVFRVRSNYLPRIELAGDVVDAWPLVSAFVSEQVL